MMEPTPTPAKAMPVASPRLRTNQFGRNSDWPEYPRQTLAAAEQDAEGGVQVPDFRGQRREQQPGGEQEDAQSP